MPPIFLNFTDFSATKKLHFYSLFFRVFYITPESAIFPNRPYSANRFDRDFRNASPLIRSTRPQPPPTPRRSTTLNPPNRQCPERLPPKISEPARPSLALRPLDATYLTSLIFHQTRRKTKNATFPKNQTRFRLFDRLTSERLRSVSLFPRIVSQRRRLGRKRPSTFYRLRR